MDESRGGDFDEKYKSALKEVRLLRKKCVQAKKSKISAIRSSKSTKNPSLKKIKIKEAKIATEELEKVEKEFNAALNKRIELSKIKTDKTKLINEPIHYEKFGKPEDINTTWLVFYNTMQYLHRGEVDKNCRLVCRWWNDLILKDKNQLPLRTIEELCYGFRKTNPYTNTSRWGYQYCIGVFRDYITPKIRNNGLRSCVFKNFHAFLVDDKFYKKLKIFVDEYGKKIKVKEVKLVFPEQGPEMIEKHFSGLQKIWGNLIVGDRLRIILGESSENAWDNMVDARSFSHLLAHPSLINLPQPHVPIEIACNDKEFHGIYDMYEYDESVLLKFLSGRHFNDEHKISLRLQHHSWNRNFGMALAKLFLEHENPKMMVSPIITEEYTGYEQVWITLQYFRSRNLPHHTKRNYAITTYEAERPDGWLFVMDYFSKRYPKNSEFLKFSFRPPRGNNDSEINLFRQETNPVIQFE